MDTEATGPIMMTTESPTVEKYPAVPPVGEGVLFTPLVEADGDAPGARASIARAGIRIHFPRDPQPGYFDLLVAELALKADFLAHRQALEHLSLSGAPMSQLSTDELTELVFRLCTRNNLRRGSIPERCIELDADQCRPDNLALAKGLGFGRLIVKLGRATSADSGLDTIKTALATARDYFDNRVAGTVSFGARTDPRQLDPLLDLLTASGVAALNFELDTGTPIDERAAQTCDRIFSRTQRLLGQRGYRLLGNRLFVHPDHPYLGWLAEGRLLLGPWGLYNAAIGDWLGLGVGATSLLGGRLYSNTADASRYRHSLQAGRLPGCTGEEDRPVELAAYRFLYQLCRNRRLQDPALDRRPQIIAPFEQLRWLEPVGNDWHLTPSGAAHLPFMSLLYTQLCQQD